MKPLKIGNAQAFWGDSPDAAAQLLSQQPDLDYLTLDYLSEVSLSIMAIQRAKDSACGYAKDFVEVVRSLKDSPVKIITNAGGLDPWQCAKACAQAIGNKKKIGVVTGDDVLKTILSSPSAPYYHNLDNKASIVSIAEELVTANAYLGASSIVEALQMGADIVITGRVADPSLTVAPCLAHFGWTDYNKIAQATLAGHLIECGTQATGGISTNWLELETQNIGFPFVEIDSTGSFIITKPRGTGGRVDKNTVREQLLYELGDPNNYISPDVVMSVMNVSLQEEGEDRVRVTGAEGRAPTDFYKVSATYRDGYRAEGSLVIAGRQVRKKAERSANIILDKMREAGKEPSRWLVECLGCGDVVPGVYQSSDAYGECILRIAIADKNQETVEYFTRLIAPLVTGGAPGTTGYTTGRPHVRPVFGFWPCLIPKKDVRPKVEVL